MQFKSYRWLGAFASIVMLIFAGNAWGFSIPAAAAADKGASASSQGSAGHESSGHSGSHNNEDWSFEPGLLSRSSGGSMDEESGSAGGGPGFGFDGDQGFDFGGDWLARIQENFEQHPGDDRAGGRFDHAWWREYILNECNTDCGLAEWIEFKQQAWEEFNNRRHEGPPGKPSPIPLPAPLLLFVSGLIGLGGFSRRSKTAAVAHS